MGSFISMLCNKFIVQPFTALTLWLSKGLFFNLLFLWVKPEVGSKYNNVRRKKTGQSSYFSMSRVWWIKDFQWQCINVCVIFGTILKWPAMIDNKEISNFTWSPAISCGNLIYKCCTFYIIYLQIQMRMIIYMQGNSGCSLLFLTTIIKY